MAAWAAAMPSTVVLRLLMASSIYSFWAWAVAELASFWANMELAVKGPPVKNAKNNRFIILPKSRWYSMIGQHLKTLRPPRRGCKRGLDRVSFEWPRNSLTAVIGPNGAGQTTRLNLL